jgi:hypothetical protein
MNKINALGEAKTFLDFDSNELAKMLFEEFIKIMDNLNLARPVKIDEAVPANLKCGLF